jgi:hypothetical protein
VGRALALMAAATTAFPTVPAHAEEADPIGGRFLFAGDDDWDWASPLGAENPSKLVRYGTMAWSALDWAEDGLKEVRGMLVGVPPDPKKTMSMPDLSKLRGEHATYQHHPQAPGVITRLLRAEPPPNVIILMQNSSRVAADPDAISVKELVVFVKGGGRLVVLDEWGRYKSVLNAVVETSLTLPPGEGIPETPAAKRPDPKPKDEDKDNLEGNNKGPDSPEAQKEKTRETREKELKARLTRLIPKLGDQTFKVRDATSREIRKMGPEVLKLLDEFQSDDPEISSRIAQLRKQLAPKKNIAPRKAPSTPEQRAAARIAKRQKNAALVKAAAEKLSAKKTSHQLSEVLVDTDQQILPVLRISFPVPK